MKICIPVAEYHGLNSPIYGHFGSAPCFVLMETDNMTLACLPNRDHHHVHGACNPVKAIAGAKPDAVIVGGIGAGMVADAVRQFKAMELPEIEQDGTYTGHASGHDCNLNNSIENRQP